MTAPPSQQNHIYMVLLEDRHADIEVHVFADYQKALAAFEAVVADYAEALSWVPEEDQMSDDALRLTGWYRHRVLTTEGAQVRLAPLLLE